MFPPVKASQIPETEGTNSRLDNDNGGTWLSVILIGRELGEWKTSMVLVELVKEGAVKDLWSEWETEMEDLRLEDVAIDEKFDEIEEDWGWAQC